MRNIIIVCIGVLVGSAAAYFLGIKPGTPLYFILPAVGGGIGAMFHKRANHA